MPGLTRRSLLAGAALGAMTVATRRLRAAEFAFTQFHNQTETSALNRRLVEMWTSIGVETGGRVETRVFAGNNGIAGSDPAALAMLVAGDIQFFTVMGGILGTVVPAAEAQQVPFAFSSAAHAFEAVDGPMGAYLRDEMAARGIQGFAVGAFDNGMRQIGGRSRPVARPPDLSGMRMRVPAGRMVADMFRTLGAEPVTINSNGIYDALAGGVVDAQENPLALIESFRLHEVTKYVSLTNHMWSGFNLLAHLPTWRRLPGDVRGVIERNVARYVRLQRQDQERTNARLVVDLAARGLVFNRVEIEPFRRQLSGFYREWKRMLGNRCWTLLEEAAGRRIV
jgi:tripartite ATP-independent transporter DctP family solute receptor